ncbi:MAG: hypothetical protein JSU96_05730 [Acidobacteriota bacterium]|nr:MAG: hypothetical protein JSU96_05730 [Acidobacteriota bacterium]
MSGHLLMVVAIVAVILVIVGVERLSHRRRTKASSPDCNMEQAWQYYLDHPQLVTERDRKVMARFEETLESEGIEELRQNLRSIETEASDQPAPLQFIREKIMNATDRFMMIEYLSGLADQAPSADFCRDVLQAGALRTYAGLKYGDFSAQDWYAHYLKMAEMHTKNVTGMIENSTQGNHSSLESSLHEPLSQSMREVRKALLKFPVRTQVLSDELLGPRVAAETASEKQVAQLASLMRARFNKLFSGQLYGSVDSALVNPGGLFKVESAILYTQLVNRFPDDDQAWSKVMDQALSNQPALLQDKQNLLSIGRHFQGTWSRTKEGPLMETLTSGSTLVCTSRSNGDQGRQFAQQVKGDAMELVRLVTDIVVPALR